MSCGLVYGDGLLRASLVRRQSVVALSSGEAELYGATLQATESIALTQLFEWLGPLGFVVTSNRKLVLKMPKVAGVERTSAPHLEQHNN
eukprot:932658-Amphidinium_carterae.3